MHLPVELPRIQRLDNTEFGRLYLTPEKNKYPSVTTVFSVIDNPGLDAWRKAVGAEEAKRIGARAAKRGTFVHSMTEAYLKGEEPRVTPIDKMLYGSNWKRFKPLVDRIGDTYAIEGQLYSDTLMTAGTVDCVGMWEGKLSIIDFKTSTRKKRHEDIDSYWMQCAAYSRMWFERTGQKIEDLVILMSVEDDDSLVFNDKVSNWLDKFVGVRVKYKRTFGV